MDREFLRLVDQYGNRTGTAERVRCHLGNGMRHLAFVILLRDSTDKVMVQNRHADKLGGDRWDVSATSHVRSNENFASAIRRCLAHELGIIRSFNPSYLLSYTYQEKLGTSTENEYCSLFVIPYDGEIVPNRNELVEYRWVSLTQLTNWYRADSNQFTRWFGEAFERFLRYSNEVRFNG